MGQRIGKYEVLEELGSGGMAMVYRARDSLLNRFVALKVMNERLQGGERARKRFMQEGRAAAALSHPNIVSVYELGIEDDIPFIAMEYLAGEDLRQVIEDRRPVALAVRLSLARQVALALEHAHSRGVIHRDIKPGNIRIVGGAQAKLMDFGIAKLMSDDATRLTRTGGVIGTVAYMAPEQLRGEPLSAAADVFAFGVLLYELLTYRTPFPGPHSPSVMHRILYTEPDPIGDVPIPSDVERLIGRCLQKPVEQRLSSFSEIGEVLRRAQSSAGVGSSVTAVPARSETAAGTTGLNQGSRGSQDSTDLDSIARIRAGSEPASTGDAGSTSFVRRRRAAVVMVSTLLVGLGVAAWTMRAGRVPGDTVVGATDAGRTPALETVARPAAVVPTPVAAQPSMAPGTMDPPPTNPPLFGARSMAEGFVTKTTPTPTPRPAKPAVSPTRRASPRPMVPTAAAPPGPPTPAPGVASVTPPISAVPIARAVAREVRVGAPDGARLCVDGQPVAATRVGVGWVLKEVPVGGHQLRVIHPGLGTADVMFEADAGPGAQRILLKDNDWSRPSFRATFKNSGGADIPFEGRVGQTYRVALDAGRALNVTLGDSGGSPDAAELRIEDERGIGSTVRCTRSSAASPCSTLSPLECGTIQ